MVSAAHASFGRSIANLFGPNAAMPIVRISRCTRLQLSSCPSVLSSLAMRREPRKGQAVNQLAEPPHQRQIVLVLRPQRALDARPRDPWEPTLTADRQPAVAAIEERSPVPGAQLSDLRAKKSRSTMSCPTFACRRSISRSRSTSTPVAALKRPGHLILKLLLPRIYLIRVYLLALSQISRRRLFLQRLQRDLRLQRRIDLPSRLAHNPLRLAGRNSLRSR